MEGTYFYWIAWMTWIICTFFMNKTKMRLISAVLVLILIITSNYQTHIHNIMINFPLIILLLSGYYFLATKTAKEKVYLLICTITLTIAYCSFQLFELFDPIWLIFNRKWMFSILLVYLTLMLIKEPKSRLIGVTIGACQGDILYGFVLSEFRFSYEIGSLLFLDVVAISGFAIYIWSKLEGAVQYFDVMFQKNTKEKHG